MAANITPPRLGNLPKSLAGFKGHFVAG